MKGEEWEMSSYLPTVWAKPATIFQHFMLSVIWCSNTYQFPATLAPDVHTSGTFHLFSSWSFLETPPPPDLLGSALALFVAIPRMHPGCSILMCWLKKTIDSNSLLLGSWILLGIQGTWQLSISPRRTIYTFQSSSSPGSFLLRHMSFWKEASSRLSDQPPRVSIRCQFRGLSLELNFGVTFKHYKYFKSIFLFLYHPA